MFRPATVLFIPFVLKKGKGYKNSFLFFSFACILSRFSHVQHFVTPWTVARQTPLSVGVSRQEDWSGLPFHSPGDLPHPGTEPVSPALADRFLPAKPAEKPPFFFLLPATNSTKWSIDRKMKTERYTSILQSYPALNQNGIMPVTTAWMDRVITMLRRGRPREKDKHHKVSLTGIFLKLVQM